MASAIAIGQTDGDTDVWMFSTGGRGGSGSVITWSFGQIVERDGLCRQEQ